MWVQLCTVHEYDVWHSVCRTTLRRPLLLLHLIGTDPPEHQCSIHNSHFSLSASSHYNTAQPEESLAVQLRCVGHAGCCLLAILILFTEPVNIGSPSSSMHAADT